MTELIPLLQLVLERGNPFAFIVCWGFSEALLLPYLSPSAEERGFSAGARERPPSIPPRKGSSLSPNPGPTPAPPAQTQDCQPGCLLFVGCSDNNTALLLVHTDTVDFLGVGEVSNPPLETHLGVLAHEDGLQKANPTPGLFLRVGRDAPSPKSLPAGTVGAPQALSAPSDAPIAVTGQALRPCPGVTTSKTPGHSFRQTRREHCAGGHTGDER